MLRLVQFFRSAVAKISQIIQYSPEIPKMESNDALFCVMGIDEEVDLTFQMYDVENDEWYPEIILPFSDWQGIFMSKSKIYVVNPDSELGEEHGIEVSTYDVKTEEEISIHVSTIQFLGIAVGMYEDYIYFIKDSDRFIHRYKISNNTVEEKIARTKESYLAPEVVFLDGLLYILGTLFSHYKESDCETYDTKTHEIKSIAPFPVSTPRRRTTVLSSSRLQGYISATDYRGKIYAIVDNSLRNLYVYTPAKNKWDVIVNKFPPAIGCYGILRKCGGKLICVDFYCFIHIYHPESNTWDSRRDYNGPLQYMRFFGEIDKPSSQEGLCE